MLIELPQISPEEIQALPTDKLRKLRDTLIKIKRFNAKQDFLHFVKYSRTSGGTDYKDAWFHRVLANKLQQVQSGECTRLIGILPPQHGKTEQVSRKLPAYVLGKNPNEKIIACSYNDSYASSNNRDVQRVMDSTSYHEVFPNTLLNPKNVRTESGDPLRNSDLFEVVEKCDDGKLRIRGSYYCAGVGGGITGKGYTLGIIDDYLKGAKDAESPVIRQRIWDWWESEFYTRRAPNARIVIIATRWHEDDLIGRLLQRAKEDANADQWEVVELPAQCEEPKAEYDERNIGDYLWLDYYGERYYENTKASTTAYYWSAVHQGKPTAREGNVIKRSWYEPYEYSIDFSQVKSKAFYWDLGGSDHKDADSTVGTWVVQTKDGIVHKLWQFGGQWSPKNRDKHILEYSQLINKIMPGIRIYAEAGVGLGVQAVTDILNMLLGAGLAVKIDKVNVSKYIRASAQKDSYFSAAENSRIKIYAGPQLQQYGFKPDDQVAWINNFFNETGRLQFKQTPEGVMFVGGHDDRLDSSVGAYNKVTKPDFFGAM